MLLKLMGMSVLSLASALTLTGVSQVPATISAGCPCPVCDCGADCGCPETGSCDCGVGCCADGCNAAESTESAAATLLQKVANQPASAACCTAKNACCEDGAACCDSAKAVALLGCPGCAGAECQAAGCSDNGCCEGDCGVDSCGCAAGCCEAGCCEE